MTDSATLFAPVHDDLQAVEACLTESASGQNPLLAELLRYVFSTRGKRLRPALVLLSGALGEYDAERLVWLAASLEVVHTASLVHDDTLDGALKRRGIDTVNSVWDQHTAIVTGDFLFAKSAELASRMESVRIMTMLSQTVMAMCAGEMRQYAARNNWNLSVEEYLGRVGDKTGSLFQMCCAGSAVATGQTEGQIRALSEFGYKVGLAFQIIDDVLDFTSDDGTLGKPAGNDLAQGTITLPVILFLNSLSNDQQLRERLLHGEDADLASELIRESSALTDARSHARNAVADAVSALGEFGNTAAVSPLKEIAESLLDRRM